MSILSPRSFQAIAASSARLVAVDASWFMPNAATTGAAAYALQRLPGAVFFDIDGVKDPALPYPHMLPLASAFATAVLLLGIAPADRLVVYDQQGVFLAPRAAWMFGSVFKHPGGVAVLDHFKAYVADGGAVETTAPDARPAAAYPTPDVDTAAYVLYEELLQLVESGELAAKYQLLDARLTDRFTGAAPEPRPGLSSGHVPGALSVPFTLVLDAQGHLHAPSEMALRLERLGVDLGRPTIAMCGTGVTACVLRLALLHAGATAPVRVYDGLWTEWASRAPDAYIAKQ